MRFFGASLKVNTKYIMSINSFFPALVLIISLVIGVFIENELILQPDIGVLYAGSPISDEIIEDLRGFSNINIVVYNDMGKMLEDVSARKIECAYAFNENADKYVMSGALNRVVKLYKSPSTVSDGFTNELVFASLMKASAPYISANYLTPRAGADYSSVLSDAEQTIRAYYEDDIFLDIQIIPLGSENVVSSKGNPVLEGVTAVFIFIMSLYTMIGGIGEKRRGVFEKLSDSSKTVYLAAYFCAHGVYIFAISLICTPFLRGAGILRVVAALGLYVGLLSLISFAAALRAKSANAIYALLPVISVSVIILGGAFFDLGEISPALGNVSRLFPTYWFVRLLR